ncbi:CsbD family protein [Paraburkholderia bengalensis]|uniref:CsbD family protein n=1 Tax=Paraburkholderia bengalensis TaxID=2747562 RepID=A0ABU8J3T5_9BURK
METTKIEGTLRETAGNVKEAVGSIAGDTRTQLEGAANELRGKAQQLCADASDLARDTMASNPLAVLAGASAVGFLLGALWASSRRDY